MRKVLVGSEYDLKSLDQSRDFGVVSIHNNNNIYMTSDDVIVSGVNAIISVGDVIVHMRQLRRIMVAAVFNWF